MRKKCTYRNKLSQALIFIIVAGSVTITKNFSERTQATQRALDYLATLPERKVCY